MQAEYSGTNELNNEVGTIDALEEIDFFVVEQEETSEDVLREIYANLAPEAKEKALQVIASNPDLLSYYVEEIDPTFSADQAMCGSNGIFRVGARANDPTKNIERRLTALGVPSAVILAAVAAATSLVYAAAMALFFLVMHTLCSPIRSGLPAMTTATRRSTLSMTVGFLSSTAPTATSITTATFPTNLL